MTGVVLALVASVSWGSADFLGGVTSKRLPTLTVSAVSQFVGFLFTLVLVLVTGAAVPGERALLYGFGAGLLGSVALVALYAGLAIGPMGVVAPLVSMSALLPFVVGLLQGERPEAIQLVGAALALGGVALAARHRDEEGARVHPRAVVLAIVAAVGFGSMFVLLHEAAAGGAAWSVLMVRVGSVSLLLVALIVRRPSFSMDREQLATLAGIGVLDNGANMLFVLAAQRGLLSLIAVLASLYPVTTVLLARVSLNERLSRIQIVGVVAALTGVALIAL